MFEYGVRDFVKRHVDAKFATEADDESTQVVEFQRTPGALVGQHGRCGLWGHRIGDLQRTLDDVVRQTHAFGAGDSGCLTHTAFEHGSRVGRRPHGASRLVGETAGGAHCREHHELRPECGIDVVDVLSVDPGGRKGIR